MGDEKKSNQVSVHLNHRPVGLKVGSKRYYNSTGNNDKEQTGKGALLLRMSLGVEGHSTTSEWT